MTTTKRFDELVTGDVVVEEVWDGDDGATQTIRSEYLGDNRFRDLSTGRVEVENASAWMDFEVED